MDPANLLPAAQGLQEHLIEQIAELVTCESPPGSVPHLTSCANLLAYWGRAVLGRAPERVVRDGLPHLYWPAGDHQVLVLGHFDTVWPAGSIRSWPFTVTGTTATGPGACDMKAGIVQLFAALSLMPDPSRVGVLLTCDEETGSVTSRPLIEQAARRSAAVLVCEPGTPEGNLKVARKGGSVYRLNVRGRAAHAGVDPHRGLNATVEVAHQVLVLDSLAAAVHGTSVTPTVLSAGTTTNTVPERASVAVDVRAWTGAELHRVDRAIRALLPREPEVALSVDGGINRYPMSRELAQPLLEAAQTVARQIGVPVPDGADAPGASDGNFTAALGLPTLDGLGAVGGGAHARDEYIELRHMPARVALLSGLLARLTGEHSIVSRDR